MLGINIFKRLGGAAAKGGVIFTGAAVVGPTYAQWLISFDGFTYKRRNSGAFIKGPAWLNPQIGMNLYEVRATLASGDPPPGILGTWLSLSDSQVWGWANETSEQSCQLTIEIRRKSDGVIVTTANVSIMVAGI